MAKFKLNSNLPQPRLYFGLIVGLIVVIAAWLRLNQLTQPQRYIFDEDYFAFTAALMTRNQALAYEFWHLPFTELSSPYLYRPPAVEWLHPPLAKLLIAGSIQLIGNQPLGWRLLPALSGICLVALAIILSLRLFPNHRWAALLGGLLVALDHLLVVESRLAGANMVLTVLTTLTVFLTYLFWQKTQTVADHQQKLWLITILLGLAVGLASATKWSGVFIALGCLGWLVGQIKQLPRQKIISLMPKLTMGFVIIPWVVYVLSYSQFFLLTKWNVQAWWQLQTAMLTFQTTTPEQHAFQSRPWQWPLNQVAIPYYLPDKSDVYNPAIWAGSWLLPLSFSALITTIAVLILARKKNLLKPGDGLLVTAILCFWLPWFFISRNLFLYHFLPAVPLIHVLLSQRLFNLTQFLANKSKRPKN